MVKFKAITLAIFSVMFILEANSQSGVSLFENKIDSLFLNYNSNTPGVAVAIVQNGKTIFQKGYGRANLEHQIPITAETVFSIGSVSKQFTAFSIYLLQEKGKLTVEDDIQKYFPDWPVYKHPIKIKHLLSHTSGLRDQWGLLTLAGWTMEDPITTDQILKLAKRQRSLNFETGSGFGYSNTGYSILAAIISKVSGQTFAAFTSENIFKPLGMMHSRFLEDVNQLIPGRADSYQKVNGVYETIELNHSNAGPTNLMTTAADLTRWVNNFYHPTLGSATMIREFNKISLLDNKEPVIWAASPGDTTFHAKGQLHWKHMGLNVISHGGHDAGFRAVLTRFPEQQFAIITLSNDEHYTMLGKVLPIAELFLADHFVKQPSIPTSPVSQPVNNIPFTADLNSFEGIYTSEELMTTYEIRVHSGKLVLKNLRLADMEMTRVADQKFKGVNSFAFELEFVRENNRVTGFEISNFGVKKLRFIRKQ
jgi:CubicO group peptidase (beta-lactamase class C family)